MPTYDFEQSLYKKLSTTTAITDLVSTRIYPDTAPQAVSKPYITYARVSGYRYHHQGGDSGITSPVYQFDIYGISKTTVMAVGAALRTLLQNFSGSLYSGGVTVQAVLMENEISEYEEETSLYRLLQEYKFFYVE